MRRAALLWLVMALSDSTGGIFQVDASDAATVEERVAKLETENLNLRNRAEHHSASISHLAHELRTPLTSILGFSEILLSQEKLTDAQRNFCERIQNSAHQLQRTLTQLSELSRTIVSSDSDQY